MTPKAQIIPQSLITAVLWDVFVSQESLAEVPSLREGVSLLPDPCPGMEFCPSASAVCVEQC
ncbi:hypothetical protein EK904_006509 [Melospiza melodia maxima]|nr:hypothetical protein EK904_006509 [Melospiza melodia maxima]